MVAERENSALAATLIEQTCLKQGIEPQVLTLHSDRGAPMTSKCTAQLLADLGVTRSLSRPQVSDDNPFSEAQFKTLRHHPGFPGRFDDIHAAIAFCRLFFPWYNTEHRHGGTGMLTCTLGGSRVGEATQAAMHSSAETRNRSVIRGAGAGHGNLIAAPLDEAVLVGLLVAMYAQRIGDCQKLCLSNFWGRDDRVQALFADVWMPLDRVVSRCVF